MPAKQTDAQPFKFKVGDRVRGVSYVPPERRTYERPEAFEGTVVQVGSGYAGVDRDRAYVWMRIGDATERQALARDTTLVESAPRVSS